MGITAHWIDYLGNVQKQVKAFRVFNEAHTANNIYRMVRGINEEYGLTSKIFFSFV